MIFWFISLIGFSFAQDFQAQVDFHQIETLAIEAEGLSKKLQDNQTKNLCQQIDVFDQKKFLMFSALVSEPMPTTLSQKINISFCHQMIESQGYKNKMISHLGEFLTYFKSHFTFKTSHIGDEYKKPLRHQITSGESQNWPDWK